MTAAVIQKALDFFAGAATGVSFLAMMRGRVIGRVRGLCGPYVLTPAVPVMSLRSAWPRCMRSVGLRMGGRAVSSATTFAARDDAATSSVSASAGASAGSMAATALAAACVLSVTLRA
jgi:hypothetical protein